MITAEAKSRCPDIRIVHVETLGADVPPAGGVDAQPADHETNDEQEDEGVDRSLVKASLRPYRAASREVFKVLAESSSLVERGGIDEAFLDVTNEASALVQASGLSVHCPPLAEGASDLANK
eukprot:2193573-Amphidinium_carterae.1